MPPPPLPPGVEVTIDAADATVARVQRALKKLGYYTGVVDGSAGRSTRNAIRSFREDNGLASSTRIDSALLQALGL